MNEIGLFDRQRGNTAREANVWLRKLKMAAWLLAATTLMTSAATSHADSITATASSNATIQPAGPRAGGTGNGSNFFNIEGSANLPTNASFGVMDFTAASFGLNFSVVSVGPTFTLSLTESNQTFTKAGSLNFYLTTDTSTAFSSLKFDSTSPPGGIGTQLTPFTLLNSSPLAFTSNGTANTGQKDTYTLSLTSDLQTYVTNQLNNGGTLRFIVAAATTDTAATFIGATNTTTASRQTLNLNATLNQPTLTWTGGSGNWNAANTSGDTSWSGSPWVAGSRAAFSNQPSGTVTLTAPNTASDMVFNTTGYTIAGSAANPLTFTSGIVQVANAADTATISAVIAGTPGITKTGDGTLALSGANTYSGPTTINAGALSISSDANLSANSTSLVLGGGTLLTRAAVTLAAARTLSGTGTLDMTGGALTLNGPVNAGNITIANGTATFANASNTFGTATVNAGGSLVVSGSLVASSTGRTTFGGAGAVALSGDNSAYTGGVTINPSGPTVTLGTSTALGAAQFRFNGGGIAASTPLTGANAIRTEFSVGGNVAISGTNAIDISGAFGFFGTTNKTLTVTAPTVTITTPLTLVTGTNNTLNKAGTGRLILNGDIRGNGASTTITADTTVTGGALQVTAGGTLARGNITVTALPSSSVTLQIDDNQVVDSFSNILLYSNGTSRALLNLNYVSTTDTSTMDTINALVLDGVSQQPGVYSAATSPGYIVGTGSVLVLNTIAVPEPSTWAMLGAGCGALAFLKLRRRRAA